MPYAGSDFSPIDPNEILPYFFDFSGMLATGEFPVSATWTTTVAVDSLVYDANAALIVDGPPSITGNITGQTFYNIISGCKYLVTTTIVTNQGNTLITYSHFTGGNPA